MERAQDFALHALLFFGVWVMKFYSGLKEGVSRSGDGGFVAKFAIAAAFVVIAVALVNVLLYISALAQESDAQNPTSVQRTLERTITTAQQNSYTVRVTFDNDAKIPQNAELRVVHIMQVPDGYDPTLPEWRGRPTAEERFVSAGEIAAYSDELAKICGVSNGVATFNYDYLDISLEADGLEVQPSAPVEVTLETNAVAASESDRVQMSFFDERREGAEHADALAADNRSSEEYIGNAAEADLSTAKTYENGSKFL